MRLDKYLSQNGYFDSRNKADEAIKNEKVRINGNIIKKSSYKVNEDDKIEILGEIFVSRAAWKLKNYIDKYNIDVQGKLALDIGSSTGGFSEVLLLNRVKKVVCVDVGKNQLHSKIRYDEKSEIYEETDIREFQYPEKFDIVVSDVSFISLLKIIEKIDKLAKEDIILLFKPQFEVGKNVKRDKKGVVIDERAVFSALENFKLQCKILGWDLIREEESSILGKEGNKEYILHLSLIHI
jgi:23S rRNA (cytidine1920-2'-O)/16S rRNA (cytidine1409-2'-O)-methyltransferase